jgi:hypothetical protein
MNFCFIITTCVKTQIHSNQLLRCLNSIQKYHQSSIIYLINDSDSYYDFFFNNLINTMNNIKLIPSYNKGCGEQQIFKFILDCDNININDNVVYLHDSVILRRELDNISDIDTVKFIWHFTNHRIHWDTIIEERTTYNVDNNIITHSDLINHYLIKYFNTNNDFLNYALYMMQNKNMWVGCMGYKCIINKKCLIEMNKSLNFADIFLKFNTRRERIINESIFSIICHYLFPYINFENSYGGLYYDGITDNPGAKKQLGSDNLILLGENKYIQKISFNR